MSNMLIGWAKAATSACHISMPHQHATSASRSQPRDIIMSRIITCWTCSAPLKASLGRNLRTSASWRSYCHISITGKLPHQHHPIPTRATCRLRHVSNTFMLGKTFCFVCRKVWRGSSVFALFSKLFWFGGDLQFLLSFQSGGDWRELSNGTLCMYVCMYVCMCYQIINRLGKGIATTHNAGRSSKSVLL